jgi:hypothetical protein
MRGDVCDDRCLASGVRRVPGRPPQVSGRTHRMAARRAGLRHRDLATRPGASLLDRLARPWVVGVGELEQVEDVLRTRGRPAREEVVISVCEGSAAADRHEARVRDLQEDHPLTFASSASAMSLGTVRRLSGEAPKTPEDT